MRKWQIVAIALVGSAALLSACSGSSSGGGDSAAYTSFYSSFVQQLKASQINMASASGVSYRSQCQEFYSGDFITGNVTEADESDYVRACVDAHTGVFGRDEN